jgi:rare lipoprotein A
MSRDPAGAPAGRGGVPGPLLAGLVLWALIAAACAGPGRGTRPSPEERAPSRAEIGLASYYGRSFRGQRTASGARYDPRAMTCAHRRHPFGAVLRVTEIESGRSVLVTVTDRGPFARGRVIDLSLAAARALRILERGVARVRVERVR